MIQPTTRFKLMMFLSISLLFFNSLANAQSKAIHGTVYDASNNLPLEGATVQLKNSEASTTTDASGKFSLSAPDGAILIVSFVGYRTQEIAIGNQTNLAIRLSTSASGLTDVVVIGYGTVKKENVTGAISSITAKNLSDRANTTVSESFAGQIPGVTAQQLSSRPGAQLDIIIRGRGSISAASTPLYVVDGIPGSSIFNINPNDIQSIEILKDAASTAIYGARGGNGVVLITTNQGKKGKPVINFNSYFGLQEPNRLVRMMNRDEFIAYSIWGKNAAYMELGGSLSDPMSARPSRLQYPDSWNNPDTLPDINWQKAVLQNSPISSYQLSVSGGGDNATYLISAQHLNQEGIEKYTGFNQTNFRINTSLNVSKNLKVGMNIAPSFSTTKAPDPEGHESVYHRALATPPIVPLNGNTEATGYVVGAFANFVNPLQTLKETQQATKGSFIGSNLWLDFTPLSGLNFRSQFGYNYTGVESKYFRPANVSRGISRGSYSTSSRRNWVLQNTLNYSKTLFSELEMDVLIGQSIESNKSSSASISGNNYPNNLVPTLNAAAQITGASTSESENSLASFFGRANFNFKDKYLLTTNIRRDGSSRFGINNKWGTFPSLSIGWKLDRENFFRNVSNLDLLKIRASIGEAGNDNIGDYSSISLLSLSNYSYNGSIASGLVPSSFGNPNLRWEKIVSRNIGLDVIVFQNRIQLSVELYNNITTDMLFSRPVSRMTGFSSMVDNLGKVENKGFEFDLTTVNVRKSGFSWESRFNFSANRNKVLETDAAGAPIKISGYFGGDTYITTIGEPIGSFYGFKTNGVLEDKYYDASGNPTVAILNGQIRGNERIVDINNDGVINEADRVRLGSSQPDFTWGINNTIKIKNFDISFLIYGAQGAKLFYPNQVYMSFGQVQGMNSTPDWVRSWKPSSYAGNQNPFPATDVDMSWDGKTPLSYAIGGAIPFSSDYFFRDASFIRLKNISVGYNIPPNSLKRVGIQFARIVLMADNLHTWTKYPGPNPEANGLSGRSDSGTPGDVADPLKNGTDWGALPMIRKFSLGVNIKL